MSEAVLPISLLGNGREIGGEAHEQPQDATRSPWLEPVRELRKSQSRQCARDGKEPKHSTMLSGLVNSSGGKLLSTLSHTDLNKQLQAECGCQASTRPEVSQCVVENSVKTEASLLPACYTQPWCLTKLRCHCSHELMTTA